MNEPPSTIGRSSPTSQAVAKVTGTFQFGDDIHLRKILAGAVLRSPHPHARIENIDFSRAKRIPGVVAVITGKDFTGLYGPAITDQPILARNVVRYAREAVAAVAAAIGNAIFDALGIRLTTLPVTPKKVLEALRNMEITGS